MLDKDGKAKLGHIHDKKHVAVQRSNSEITRCDNCVLRDNDCLNMTPGGCKKYGYIWIEYNPV